MNVEPVTIKDCNDAYLVAKNEVSSPHDPVTFRFDVNSTLSVDWWEVTFGRKDDPDAPSTIVYMDGEGRTEPILYE